MSIHRKWLKDSETKNRRKVVGRPCLIKERGGQRLARSVQQDRPRSVLRPSGSKSLENYKVFVESMSRRIAVILCSNTLLSRSSLCFGS